MKNVYLFCLPGVVHHASAGKYTVVSGVTKDVSVNDLTRVLDTPPVVNSTVLVPHDYLVFVQGTIYTHIIYLNPGSNFYMPPFH
jgi:hypothetical protein